MITLPQATQDGGRPMNLYQENYVEGCATCQATKIRPKNKVPRQPNQIPTDIWGIITMDFNTDLPVSQGFDSLFVVVDRLSKATIIAPFNKTITVEETAKLHMNHI